MSQQNKKNISTKQFFGKFGIFCGAALFFLLILGYFIIVSKNSWNNNLKKIVEVVLEENSSGIWSVESLAEINNPSKLKSAAYHIRNRESGEHAYAYITRVPSFYGPMGGVFICTDSGQTTFNGFVSLHGKIKNQLIQNRINKRLDFAAERIPVYLELITEDKNE